MNSSVTPGFSISMPTTKNLTEIESVSIFVASLLETLRLADFESGLEPTRDYPRSDRETVKGDVSQRRHTLLKGSNIHSEKMVPRCEGLQKRGWERPRRGDEMSVKEFGWWELSSPRDTKLRQ